MQAIVNTAPNRLEMLDLPAPVPAPGQVRVRTAACAICATDMEMIRGWARTPFPAIPGHEWAGVVDAVGAGVDPALGGRLCVGENVLADGGEVGFEHPGGYAECFLTEARNLHPLPDDFPPAAAALIEPLAVCVRGLRRLRADALGPVLIFGDGPIGLLMTLLTAGRERTLVGGRAGRLDLAREFGARDVLDYRGMDGRLPRAGFPTIIEASGSPEALSTAMDMLAPAGRILVIGDYGDARADFPWNRILHGEMELIGSNASAGGWPEAVRLAVEEHLPLDRLISHRLPASEFAKGLDLVRGQGEDVVKVVLEWM